MRNKLILKEKEKLTSDVFKLSFSLENKKEAKEGQFINFLLPESWWRAYSILEQNWYNLSFIIKRVENGRWWSKEICDLELWTELKWVWPAGHFLLNNNTKNKLFIWTGAWLVPLYFMIKNINKDIKSKLLFWVRTKKDLFYLKKLDKIKKINPNFDYEVFLSKEETNEYNKWYVTNYLNKENIKDFWEFYICWAPAMIDDSSDILKNLWVDKKNIFFEKF